eukprot:SAG22_NODE_1221_length_5129_cov_18.963419_2_plen_64_part_00
MINTLEDAERWYGRLRYNDEETVQRDVGVEAAADGWVEDTTVIEAAEDRAERERQYSYHRSKP